MAYRRMRRFRRTSGGNARRRLWTAVNDIETLTVGNTYFLPLVIPSDYRDAATLEPGNVTHLRSRGNLTFQEIPGNLLTGVLVVSAAIYVVDADGITTGSLNPATAQNLIDEQCLWQAVYTFSPVGVYANHFDVDVKAKRVLRDMNVELVMNMVGTAGDDMNFNCAFRSLLLK